MEVLHLFLKFPGEISGKDILKNRVRILHAQLGIDPDQWKHL